MHEGPVGHRREECGIMRLIARRLAAERITYKWLAGEVGVSPRTVASHFSGTRRPKEVDILAYLDALGVRDAVLEAVERVVMGALR